MNVVQTDKVCELTVSRHQGFPKFVMSAVQIAADKSTLVVSGYVEGIVECGAIFGQVWGAE